MLLIDINQWFVWFRPIINRTLTNSWDVEEWCVFHLQQTNCCRHGLNVCRHPFFPWLWSRNTCNVTLILNPDGWDIHLNLMHPFPLTVVLCISSSINKKTWGTCLYLSCMLTKSVIHRHYYSDTCYMYHWTLSLSINCTCNDMPHIVFVIILLIKRRGLLTFVHWFCAFYVTLLHAFCQIIDFQFNLLDRRTLENWMF